jgi:hypothetical protein
MLVKQTRRKKNMKNVKVILISCALFATIFANARTDALGGDPGFWPGDRANLDAFPATINDLGFVEIDGVQNMSGAANAAANTTIVWGDATKWGFGFDNDATDDDNPWFNISWGNGSMGLNIAYISTDDGSATSTTDATTDESGFKVKWGQSFDWGELGVNFESTSNTCGHKCDDSSYGLNWRGGLDAWVFDTAKAELSMTSMDDEGTSGDEDTMDLGFDLFTHMDVASGATVLFALGFDYETKSQDKKDGTWITLPAATVAVETALTDWATLRAFASHSYTLSCDNKNSSGSVSNFCTDGSTGVSGTDYGFGLGFDWGSVSLDMEIDNQLFVDPVSNITGDDDGDLANGRITLGYTF